jgi:hypothetical protein
MKGFTAAAGKPFINGTILIIDMRGRTTELVELNGDTAKSGTKPRLRAGLRTIYK